MTHVTGNRVVVIGGGVAGLVSAKVLMQDGFDVTVFEKAPTPGGVWCESRAYPGLRTNNPRETYAFSDFAYPEGTAEFPTAAEVRRYLDAYARHFGLTPHIRCMTEVTSVETLEDAPRQPNGVTGSPFAATTGSNRQKIHTMPTA